MACRPPIQNPDAPRRTSPRRGIAPKTCARCSRDGWRGREGLPRRSLIFRQPSTAGRTIPPSARYRSPPKREPMPRRSRRPSRPGAGATSRAPKLCSMSPCSRARAGWSCWAPRGRPTSPRSTAISPGATARRARAAPSTPRPAPIRTIRCLGRTRRPVSPPAHPSRTALPLPRHRRRPRARGRRPVAARISGLCRHAVLGHPVRLRQRRRGPRQEHLPPLRRDRPVTALGKALRPRVPRPRLRRGARLLAQAHRAPGATAHRPCRRGRARRRFAARRICLRRSGAIVTPPPCRRSWPLRRGCRSPSSGRPADRGKAGACGPACRRPPAWP